MGFFSAAHFVARLFTRRFFRVDGAALPPSVFLVGAEPSTDLIGAAVARVDLPVMLAVPPALSLVASIAASASLLGAAVAAALSGRMTALSLPTLLAEPPAIACVGAAPSTSLLAPAPATLLTGRAPVFGLPILRGVS